jgi:DNA-directed RNA polymerase subunit RPC12/RpoP
MAKFTCPFCIREYEKSKVLYVCPECGETATPKTFEREPIKCRNCGRVAKARRCPSCHNEIPKAALETPNLPFSIVGVSTSGKTNYITVMLHELGRGVPGLKLSLAYQTDETRDHQRENYERIYEKHTRAEFTSGEIQPQIWCIWNNQKKHGNDTPAYTFTIFDGAGEKHENLDPSSTECRYIEASKAIILVIDPLVLSGIRKGGVVDPDVMTNSLGGYSGETKNAADVINNVALYIKSARGIRTSRQLEIPVAVVLTKFDTIINHRSFGPRAVIKGKSLNIRNGKVDTNEIEQVDGEIRSWLCEIGESAFINVLESHFKEFYFFGVSSFGAPPVTRDTLVNNIRPHRVLDPILWLFKKSKFID